MPLSIQTYDIVHGLGAYDLVAYALLPLHIGTVLQSKRANFVVFKIFCYFQESVQEGSTLSLWEDTTSTCTGLLEVTCCHVI